MTLRLKIILDLAGMFLLQKPVSYGLANRGMLIR